MRTRLRVADLDGTIYRADEAQYFAKAVEHLIANHGRLGHEQDRKSIFVPR